MQTLPHYTNVGHRLANVGVSAQLPWCYLSNIIMLLAHSNCWPCSLRQAWQLMCNHLTGNHLMLNKSVSAPVCEQVISGTSSPVVRLFAV